MAHRHPFTRTTALFMSLVLFLNLVNLPVFGDRPERSAEDGWSEERIDERKETYEQGEEESI